MPLVFAGSRSSSTTPTSPVSVSITGPSDSPPGVDPTPTLPIPTITHSPAKPTDLQLPPDVYPAAGDSTAMDFATPTPTSGIIASPTPSLTPTTDPTLTPSSPPSSLSPQPASLSPGPQTPTPTTVTCISQANIELRVPTYDGVGSSTFPRIRRKGSEQAAYEVAGSEEGSPTLLQIKRINSARRGEIADQVLKYRVNIGNTYTSKTYA